MFRIPAQQIVHLNDVMMEFPHPETSPGLPYTQEGIKQKRLVNPYRIKYFVHKMKYGEIGNCRTPCTAAVRTTVSQDQGKFRLIWAYPCHMTMAEGIFAQPLIQGYKSYRTPFAIWCQYGKGHMKYLASHRTSPQQRWFSIDWSRFDANVPAWLIRDAFSVLRDQLDFSKYRDHGRPTHTHTIPRLWDRVIHYFINTPIRTPQGEIRRKSRGVPSGSYFTNLVDTICNAIACTYVLKLMGHKLSVSASWFLGDDALILLQQRISTAEFARRAKQVFGFELSTSKSEVGDTFTFLGFRSTSKGVPVANFDKLLAQLLLPSGKDQCLGDFIIRARALQLSCFGVGCMAFTKLVDDVLEQLPYEEATLHWRSEVAQKLEHLGLSNWPPLEKVMVLVG